MIPYDSVWLLKNWDQDTVCEPFTLWRTNYITETQFLNDLKHILDISLLTFLLLFTDANIYAISSNRWFVSTWRILQEQRLKVKVPFREQEVPELLCFLLLSWLCMFMFRFPVLFCSLFFSLVMSCFTSCLVFPAFVIVCPAPMRFTCSWALVPAVPCSTLVTLCI